MIQFDIGNLSSDVVGAQDGLSQNDLKLLDGLAGDAHNKFQSWRKSQDAMFYDLVFDKNNTEGIEKKAKEVASRFENLVVFGIGGSALGLKCLAQALLPPFWNLLSREKRGNHPRLFVCDNIDPETFDSLLELIDIKKTCFTVISKSGKTTETAAQFFIALEKLKKAVPSGWQEHLVVITDPKAGELRPFVEKENIASFSIHPKLGGRFSVLSPVGLFPAACVGIQIKELINGACEMAHRCESAEVSKNPAYQLGGYQYLLGKKNKSMSVMIPYADSLMLMSDWYAQLWAESLGKEGIGQTPIKALGATDQHSQIQLYMEGPKDKVFTFLGVDEFRTSTDKTKINEIMGSFDYLKGHDLGKILKAEERATIGALSKMGRPNMTVTFPKVDEHHLGEFFMVYEIATAFAGALYKIDPFNQPGVELGKILTKEILSVR